MNDIISGSQSSWECTLISTGGIKMRGVDPGSHNLLYLGGQYTYKPNQTYKYKQRKQSA